MGMWDGGMECSRWAGVWGGGKIAGEGEKKTGGKKKFVKVMIRGFLDWKKIGKGMILSQSDKIKRLVLGRKENRT